MINACRTCLLFIAALAADLRGESAADAFRVTGKIVDADTVAPLPARLYIHGADGAWHFPTSDTPGEVVRYERSNYWDKNQVEMHATLSARPFTVDLPAGEYAVTVERGKEYVPLTTKLAVEADHARWRLPLQRWINIAERGWYSGDVHCHRAPEDLANLLLAEDLNVCFPQTNWTTLAETPPSRGDKTTPDDPGRVRLSASPVAVDPTHVWYPRNTEYEIFKVAGREHTLGAFIILNHRTPFDMPCPPLAAVARQAREEGALIDLEKHNWEWAAVAAPILPVDLYELANNHNWRIGFGVKNWGAPAPAWMKLQGPLTIDNEADWLQYTWQFYYALLNSGLAINPTAGSASGAHPVPVGYSRVYVHVPGDFNYRDWIAGLKAGRSFVTTGPMLLATVNGRNVGEKWKADADSPLRMQGEAAFHRPLDRIELIRNGEVVRRVAPTNTLEGDAFVSRFDVTLTAAGSGWFAVRCLALPEHGRGIPFAHTAPWHIEVAGRPLKPRRREVEYFLERVEEEIQRNRGVLTAEQLADYHRARNFWQQKLGSAVDAQAESTRN